MQKIRPLIFFVLFFFSPPLYADLASDLNDFWKKSGGLTNTTRPEFYKTPRANHATLGSLYVRTQSRNTQLVNVQLPKIRAGCGGIDIFAGSFSFLNAEEFKALGIAIMQNAAGFAFELALESLSPAIKETLDKLRSLQTLINNMNINSCEAARRTVSAVWPKISAASEHICATVGTSKGLFSDSITSRHSCNSKGKNASTLAQAPPELAEQLPFGNLAWRAIRKSPTFSSDRELSEFFMTVTGTVVAEAPANDNEGPQFKNYSPLALDAGLLDFLMFGGTQKVYRCDTVDKCIKPELKSVTLSEDNALVAKVSDLLHKIRVSIENDVTIPDDALGLLNITSIPVITVITAQIRKNKSVVLRDIESLSQIIAVDLALVYINGVVDEVSKNLANVQTVGDFVVKQGEILTQTRRALSDRSAEVGQRYSNAMAHLIKLEMAIQYLSSDTASAFAQNLTGK